MGKTSIQWTDATWNPVAGCTRVSPGCDNCYAAQLVATRLKGTRQYGGLAVITKSGRPAFTGEIRLLPERLSEPLRWRKPRRVFVNSMSDLFHERIPDDYLDRVFAVMALSSRHQFQVLTKRPERMRDYVRGLADGGFQRLEKAARSLGYWGIPLLPWPLPGVWLGTSCEDQERADERIPLLLQTPAAVRFVSAEPLLGPIDLTRSLGYRSARGVLSGDPRGAAIRNLRESGVSWVIVGGESGAPARPMHVQWARDIVRQCQAAGVAAFVKQMGHWLAGDASGFVVHRWWRRDDSFWVAPLLSTARGTMPSDIKAFGLCDHKGGVPSEWPADLRVREFPNG